MPCRYRPMSSFDVILSAVNVAPWHLPCGAAFRVEIDRWNVLWAWWHCDAGRSEELAEAIVSDMSLSDSRRATAPCWAHRTHSDTGQQLVQEQTTTWPRPPSSRALSACVTCNLTTNTNTATTNYTATTITATTIIISSSSSSSLAVDNDVITLAYNDVTEPINILRLHVSVMTLHNVFCRECRDWSLHISALVNSS